MSFLYWACVQGLEADIFWQKSYLSSDLKVPKTIHWINHYTEDKHKQNEESATYPVDSAIHPSNNGGQEHEFPDLLIAYMVIKVKDFTTWPQPSFEETI